MRRWLVLVLLALLPLQFTWAAVAAYCGHETGAPARHLGHHAHQHVERGGVQGTDADHGAAVQQADAASPAGVGFDMDCGHCHGAGLSLPAPAAGLLPLNAGARPPAPAVCAMRTWAQSPPDRPQWLGLA